MSLSPKPLAGQRKRSNEEINKDFQYFEENYNSLLAQFPNRWIAVRGEQVAASAFNYFEAEAQLEKQGIPFNEAIWEFMDADRNYVIASNWDAAIEEWQIAGMLSRMRDD